VPDWKLLVTEAEVLALPKRSIEIDRLAKALFALIIRLFSFIVRQDNQS
jgi:hypothetical protein